MSLYAPLPVELSRAVAEGRPMAAPRLLLWALVLSRAIEGLPITSVRWLAASAGCSKTFAADELRAIYAWGASPDCPAWVRGQLADNARTNGGQCSPVTSSAIAGSADKSRTSRGHSRARSSSEMEEREREEHIYGAAGPSGSVEPDHLEGPCDPDTSTSPLSPAASASSSSATSTSTPSALDAPPLNPPTTTPALSAPGPVRSATPQSPATTTGTTSSTSPVPSAADEPPNLLFLPRQPAQAASEQGGQCPEAPERSQGPSRRRNRVAPAEPPDPRPRLVTDTWAAVWTELRPGESYPWDFSRGKTVGDAGASRRIASTISDDDEVRRVVRCYLADPWHASHGPTLSKLAQQLQAVRVQAQSTAAPPARGGRDQGQGWVDETTRAAEWARKLDEKRRANAVG